MSEEEAEHKNYTEIMEEAKKVKELYSASPVKGNHEKSIELKK